MYTLLASSDAEVLHRLGELPPVTAVAVIIAAVICFLAVLWFWIWMLRHL